MAIQNIILVYALLSGIMSVSLIIFTMFFEKNKKKSHLLLIWATLFLASSFATSEYAFWLEGYNLFELVFPLNMPLAFFFSIWLLFFVWTFEMRKERETWLLLVFLLILIVLIAMNCMNYPMECKLL